MKAETPRNLALKALITLSRRPAFSGSVLDRIFGANRDLDARDRAFVSQLVQGVLRWRLRLDWIIGEAADIPLRKIDPPVVEILRLALYQVFFLDRVPDSAAVDQAVRQTKAKHPGHIASFVNGLLRNICRHKEEVSYPDRTTDLIHHLSVYYSYPVWLVEKWISELGAEVAEALLEVGNKPPPLVVRVNPLKTGRPRLMKLLEEEGFEAAPTAYSPFGVVVKGLRGRVDQLRAFKEGLLQVQGEAAQIASFFLGPVPGSTVLDLCAGFGGKAGRLAEMMGNRGRVIALDMNRERLVSLAANSKRLGIQIIYPAVADTAADVSALLRSSFDRVLVDAPCSGLGVLSRHPDGKWNRDREGIKGLALLQRTILHRAAGMVKRRGKVLYVTCTISREENEGVVEYFLKNHPDMILEDLRERAPLWAIELIDEHGFFRTLPHLHGMDGFFAALFARR
ncbi:MAG: 16S rRNA (cytosine(967)-C(5))-methyltransferase RsmB [Deltaproteobacteria bacterium]|nr:16S rRNA (cytosine(967)-C(5))-methyltransferase RsmB [Deltaproteobacteria bacterium]